MEEVTAIFIPSLNRPGHLESLIKNIRETTPEPHAVYFMISDEESREILERLGQNYFFDKGQDTRYVTRMNAMFRHTIEPYMFMGSDDVEFKPGWLTEALKVVKQGYHVVVGDDLCNADGTMALITREYIDKHSGCMDIPGVLFNPNYGHNFADTEQFATAKKRGVFARAMDSKVEHLHWVANKSIQDETYKLSSGGWEHDSLLFNSRKHLWE